MFTARNNSGSRKSLRIENKKNDAERKRQKGSCNHFTEEPPQKRNKTDDAGRKRRNSSQSSEESPQKRKKIHGKMDTHQKSQNRKKK